MTYFEMSSKLNRVLVAERERFCGEKIFERDSVWYEGGDAMETLEARELDELCSVLVLGVAGTGEEENDVVPDEQEIRPSGTWYTIFGPCRTSNAA